MADSKITSLTEITSWASGDTLAIVDVSDTSQAASGTTKKITAGNTLDKFIQTDGSVELSADWDTGDANKIITDQIQARDTDGLKLTDSSGDGLFVDSGSVLVNTTTAGSGLFHIQGSATTGTEDLLSITTSAGAGTDGEIKMGFDEDNDEYYLTSSTSTRPINFYVGSDNNFTINDTNTTFNDLLVITEDQTLTGDVTDNTSSKAQITPAYTVTDGGDHTVTRHNYLLIDNVSKTETSGTITITDGAVMRFDADAGTHVCIDAGTTKSTPGTVNAWEKVNINGTIHYIPCYTSKTT
jgi:hypothetical protein